MVILFYGQPTSGKTTLADVLCPFLGSNCVRVDGDVWREITKNKDYSKEGRLLNLKSAFDMAIYLSKIGFIPLLSFVTPYEESRQYLRDNSNLIEIYLESSIDRGRRNYFANDFENPTKECLRIDTSEMGLEDSLHEVIKYIKSKNKLFFNDTILE
jgi:adenylylsulfate kinase